MMMKSSFVFLLALTAIAFASKRFDGDQVLTIRPTTQHHVDLIKQFDDFNADFWKPDSAGLVGIGDECDIRFERKHVTSVKRALTRAGVGFEVKISDLQLSIEQQFDSLRSSREMEDYDYYHYHTNTEIEQWVHDIAASHPDLVQASVLGKTTEGRNINMLTIGTSQENPLVILDCGIHAREWIGPATCQCYVDHLLHEYEDDDQVKNMMKSLTFVIIPQINPDGYEHTWTADRMWRKNRSSYDGGACYGVDTNRNFDAHWSELGSSSNPCSDTYHGPSMASEPETQAYSGLIKSNSNRVKMTVGLHAYGQFFTYPYAYAYQDVPNNAEHESVMQGAISAIGAVNGQTYTGGPGYHSEHLSAGSSNDFSYDNGAKMAFAIELRDTGKYGFMLPESEIAATCSEVSAGLDYMFNYARSL